LQHCTGLIASTGNHPLLLSLFEQEEIFPSDDFLVALFSKKERNKSEKFFIFCLDKYTEN
jgi:hypothetical protein